MSPVTKPESSHWWKLGFKGCPARQNKTHLAEKDLPRTSEFKAGVKTEISCQCFGVAAVQCCCHEQQCAVWRSGATSANQETQNKNFMVTINAPFVFAVLTLHGHIPRCDYLGKYLDCQRFYNWGLKRAEVIITHGFGRQTGQDNRCLQALNLLTGLECSGQHISIFLLPLQTPPHTCTYRSCHKFFSFYWSD